MHLSSKLKKRILLLFMLPALFLLVCVGVLYFIVVHRFKDSIKFIVNRESKGRYAFDAGEADLSLRNKSILLKESVLYCLDTVNADACYRIKIHEIYFSLASWKDLLYHKKIIADSLFGAGPHAKYLDIPVSNYTAGPHDKVLANGKLVGLSANAGYTVNVGGWSSLAMVDEAEAIDGREVTLVIGEEGGGSAKPTVERHVQRQIRATLHTTALV